ncbi:TetR/AcrR family transcriptional regulator [Streptomyces sp. 3214.6]|uniref:TetR/AcrR family transcriptional regulator n=1 Tax=Streptomyces sp. 3214.6 TaxID=1882757 RepID=UPI00090AF41F|nr:TetR/AcrR family transcriptional regulator [Streptomyces sp. 3214.6]SHH31391.1 transcriptional regulator, TetR family [Streptomyces sp. 3214.6]
MSPQPTQPIPHKERLLRQGMKHFYAHGYHGTTVDAVLDASGVPKGSFYHHFGSKEAFGKAVLNRYMQYQLNLLQTWITDKPDLTTSEKLSGYFDEMVREFIGSDYRRACLAGKFSTEVSATSESFRTQLESDLRDWRGLLLTAIQQGQEHGDVRHDRTADELADALLALIQGAFVIGLSSRDDQALRAVSATIPLLIDMPYAASREP